MSFPEWQRERKKIFQWLPSVSLLLSIRSYQFWSARTGILAKVLTKIASFRWRIWSVLTGSDIDRSTKIGGGLLLPHPNGVVIHDRAIIGNNCMIMQQVTIGMIENNAVPQIGSNVYIGAGAKLLGAITIGDNVRIGANAVVLQDVPDNCTAVGVPARVIVRQEGS